MGKTIHQHHSGLCAGHHGSHAHVHGLVDEKLATTARGLAALKWRFIVLAGGAVVRARWIGHRLHAEADIGIDASPSVGEGLELARRFEVEVMSYLPEIRAIHLGIRTAGESSA